MHKNKFLDRLLSTTFVFTDVGDAGGGGGAPVADTPADTSTSGPGGMGGAQEQDHDFGYSHSNPTPEQTARVSSILDPNKDQDRHLDYGEIGALLGWNPSLKPKEDPKPAAAAATTTPAPATQTPPTPKTEPPTPPPSALDPNVKALTESVQALVQRSTETQAPATASTSAPAQPKRFYGDTQPELQVAPELVAAIIGSNQPEAVAQASPAINHLINGLANKVMQDAAQMLMYQQQQLMAHIPQAIVAHNTERTNTERFYDRYTELNKPAFQPLVNQAASAVVAKLQKEGKQIIYNDEFFDAVGGLVRSYVKQNMGFDLPRQIKGQPVVAAASPTQAAAPKPRFVTPQGTRPPAGPAGSSQSADLRDLV